MNAWNGLFVTGIMSYNPITLILNDNKITRPNFVNWKRNLDIVLIIEHLN